jgi:D-serine deaminase-like pyridoxal phosphate-dependent protein
MSQLPPAEPGMRLSDVETPALLIDLDALERNVAILAIRLGGTGVRLRPHAKTHKSAVIALRQMAAGAVGVCCQKVAEAEALVYAGVPDVLVSNQVVGSRKLARLAALARQARVGVCVAHPLNVAALDDAARSFGVRLDVLVEVNVGMDRCGVEPGEPVVALARAVDSCHNLRFAGLQAYQGSAQHIRRYEDRVAAIETAAEQIRMTLGLLERVGLDAETVSGGGTGSFEFELRTGVWNELQCGSYVFMDADYLKNLRADGAAGSIFEPSLFILASVMSRPTSQRAIVDVGLKSLSVDSGLPWVVDIAGVEYVGASDEHGKLAVRGAPTAVELGSKLRLIPGHCDPTVNLHEWYVCYRGDRVEAVWPVTARGAVT